MSKIEKIQSDEILKRSLYGLIAENSSDLISFLTFELQPKYIYVNPAHTVSLGYRPEELIGKPGLSVVHPDDHVRLIGILTGYLKDKINILKKKSDLPWHENFSYRVMTKTGEWRYMETSADLVDNKILLVARDVTDLKSAQLKLDLAMQSANEGMWEWDMDKNNIHLDNKTLEMFGYEQESGKGGNYEGDWLTDQVHQEDRNKLERELAEHESGKTEFYKCEYRIKHKSGKYIWVASSGKIIERDSNGKPRLMVGMHRDINEEKKQQEDLKESGERLKVLFELSPDAISFNDQNGMFIDGNKSAEILIGRKKEEAIGKSLFELGFLNKENLLKSAKILAKNVRGQETGPDELTIKRPDGTEAIAEIRTFPVSVNNKKIILTIGRDISERRRQEAKISEREKSFKNLFNSSPTGMFIYQLKGDRLEMVDSNPACSQILGNDMSKSHGLSVEEAFPPLAGTQIPGKYKEVARTGKEWRMDSFKFDDNAMGGYFEIMAFQISRDKIVVAFENIDERKKAVDALKANEDLLNTIFESASDAIFVKDQNLKYTHANSRTEKILGVPISKIIGRTDDDILKSDLARYNLSVDKRVLGGELVREQATVDNKGKLRYFHITKLPLRNSDNNVVGICGYAHDITEIITKEKELKDERDRIRKYMELLAEIVISLDAEGRVKMINRTGCEILGKPESGIVGKNWIDNFVPVEKRVEVKRIFEQVISGQDDGKNNWENPIITSSGEIRMIAWNNTVLRDEHGNIIGTLSSGQDVTKRKISEQEAEKRTQELEKFNQIMIGRELKMLELKKKIKELESKLEGNT